MIDGHSQLGHNAVGGEWGHNPLPWPDAEEYPGPLCYCGKRGCIETFLCGPALERQFQELTGCALNAGAIAEKAAEGELAAQTALAVYSRRLAKALATVINIADPDIIVFGGGLSNISVLINDAAARLPEWVFSIPAVSEERLSWSAAPGDPAFAGPPVQYQCLQYVYVITNEVCQEHSSVP